MLNVVISIGLAIVIAVLVFYLCIILVEKVLNRILIKLNPRVSLIKILVKHNLFRLFSHIAVGICLLLNLDSIFSLGHRVTIDPIALHVSTKLIQLYIFLAIIIIINKFINLVNVYYDKRFNKDNQLPINSYIQVLNLIVWLVGLILIISFFLNISPLAFLTGIGAVSALFLLLFKDTLLGIVASIQASATNIVKVGDYVELTNKSLSGTVIDISITRVKIKNDDNSISTIPTYMLTSEVIRNTSYINNYGAKLLKTSFKLNIASIKLINEELLNKLSEIDIVNNYIKKHGNWHNITNLELFREYLEDYLKAKPNVLSDAYPIIIKHLSSNEVGLPIEISIYVNDRNYYNLYKTEAQILEHVFIILGLFGLEISIPRRN